MNEIVKKYEKQLQECTSSDGVYIHINDAVKTIRSALKEYRDIYKKERRFDYWGNEIK